MRFFKRKPHFFKKLIVVVIVWRFVVWPILRSTGTYLTGVIKKSGHDLKEPNQSEQIDEYCEHNGDWYTLESSNDDGQFIYFKRSTSYYFNDINEIYLNFIRKSTSKISLDNMILNVTFMHKNKLINFEHQLDNYRLFLIHRSSVYGLYAIRARFDLHHRLEELVQESDFKTAYHNLELAIRFGDRKTNPLSLTINHKSNETGLKSSLICSKTINIRDEYDLRNFQRWVRLQTNIGSFDNMVIYVNNARLNSDELELLRDDFVHRRILKCIPSLAVSPTNKYKYYRYQDRGEEKAATDDDDGNDSFRIVSDALVNDWVLENLNKFAFMAVVDADEIIMPNRRNELSFDSEYFRKFFSKARNFENFTRLRESFTYSSLIGSSVNTNEDEINLENSSTDQHASHKYFRKKYFIDTSYVKQFCGTFYNHINSKSTQGLSLSSTIDEMPFVRVAQSNFTVIMNTHDKFFYAIYVCVIYERIIEPIELVKLNSSSSIFDRFFTIDIQKKVPIEDASKLLRMLNYSMRKNHLPNFQKFSYETDSSHADADHCLGYVAKFEANMSHFISKRHFDVTDISLDFSYLSLYLNNQPN